MAGRKFTDFSELVLEKAAKQAGKIFVEKGKRGFKKNPAPEIKRQPLNKLGSAVSDHFTVGFGTRDVMPADTDKKKYYIGGYRWRNPAIGVLDPMTASAVWIDDNSGRGGVVFVSIDNVGLLREDVNTIRARLSDFCVLTGCRSINICSTHNHASIDTMGLWGPLPKSGRDPEYMEIMFEGAKQAVFAAYADRRNGQLYLGRKDDENNLQRDSRLPWNFSKTMTRIRFVPDEGGREIYILNFASHSESLLGHNSLISADFPCYIRREIKKQIGADTIYFVGAIGGLIRLIEYCENNIESTMTEGRLLAGTAMSIQDEVRLEPVLNVFTREFYVEAENLVLMLGAKTHIINAKPYYTGKGSLSQSLLTEMTYAQLGTLNMLLLPCELFPELAYGNYLSAEESSSGKGAEINPKPLIEIAGDEKLLVFGLSNDEIGYVVPPNDYLLHPETPFVTQTKDRLGRSHYEETNGLGPKTAQIIADEFAFLISDINSL